MFPFLPLQYVSATEENKLRSGGERGRGWGGEGGGGGEGRGEGRGGGLSRAEEPQDPPQRPQPVFSSPDSLGGALQGAGPEDQAEGLESNSGLRPAVAWLRPRKPPNPAPQPGSSGCFYLGPPPAGAQAHRLPTRRVGPTPRTGIYTPPHTHTHTHTQGQTCRDTCESHSGTRMRPHGQVRRHVECLGASWGAIGRAP